MPKVSKGTMNRRQIVNKKCVHKNNDISLIFILLKQDGDKTQEYAFWWGLGILNI